MKKFLSLVLALVMAMSLVTISAGATAYKDLTDKDSVTYTEAVQVMNGLGIISGYSDGSFKPTATLTRGAAAKIIAFLNLGTDAANALTCDSAPYSDVKTTDTFAPYIAYCKNAKLIDGYADGTFKAGNTLTGFQFAKMLLTSLGYDSATEGFTGSNWSVNVAKIAVKINLFKGNSSFAGSAVVNREQACLYSFNTLKANTVKYNTSGTTIITSDGTKITTGGSTASYEDASIISTDTPVVYAGYKDAGNDAFVQFVEAHFPNLKCITSGKTAANGWAGHDWKLTTAAKAFSDIFANDMGSKLVTYTDTSDLTKGDMYKACTWADSVDVYVNGTLEYGTSGASGAALATSSFVSKGSTASAGLNYKGVDFSIYDTNSDGKADTIVVTIAYLAKVTAVTAATASTDRTITVTAYDRDGGKSAVITTDKFAKDDYIMITPSSNDSTGFATPVAMTAATKVTATVTAENATKNTLVADGTTYKFSTYAFLGGSTVSSYDLSAKYDFFMDSYGYIIGANVNTSATTTLNFVYVNAASVIGQTDTLTLGISAKEAKVKVTYLDGSNAVLNLPVKTATGSITGTIKSGADASATGVTIAKNDCYVTVKAADGTTVYYKLIDGTNTNLQNVLAGVASYSMNDDGTIVISKVVSTTGSTVYTAAAEATSLKTVKGSAVIDATTDMYATTSTKLVVVGSNSTMAYTGYANFPSMTYLTTSGTNDSSNTYGAKIVYVASSSHVVTDILVLGAGTVSNTAVDAYGYYLGAGNKTSDGQYYDFYVDGAVKSYLKVDDSVSLDTATPVYGLTFDSKGAIATAAAGTMDKQVTYVGDGFIVAGGQVLYTDKTFSVYNVTVKDTINADSIEKDDYISYAVTTTDNGSVQHLAVAFIVTHNAG